MVTMIMIYWNYAILLQMTYKYGGKAISASVVPITSWFIASLTGARACLSFWSVTFQSELGLGLDLGWQVA